MPTGVPPPHDTSGSSRQAHDSGGGRGVGRAGFEGQQALADSAQSAPRQCHRRQSDVGCAGRDPGQRARCDDLRRRVRLQTLPRRGAGQSAGRKRIPGRVIDRKQGRAGREPCSDERLAATALGGR